MIIMNVNLLQTYPSGFVIMLEHVHVLSWVSSYDREMSLSAVCSNIVLFNGPRLRYVHTRHPHIRKLEISESPHAMHTWLIRRCACRGHAALTIMS